MPQPRSMPEGIRPGYNGTGADIGAYLVVKKSAAIEEGVLLPAGSGDAIFGVTRDLIRNKEFGNVQTRGIAICVAGGAVTRGDLLMADAAGKVVPWAAAVAVNASVVGIANGSATLNGELEVELAGPGVSRQG